MAQLHYLQVTVVAALVAPNPVQNLAAQNLVRNLVAQNLVQSLAVNQNVDAILAVLAVKNLAALTETEMATPVETAETKATEAIKLAINTPCPF